MKMHYDLEAVRQGMDGSQEQLFVDADWVLLSAEPAGMAKHGISHEDLLCEVGWACRIDDGCCRNRQSGRRR